MQHLQHNVERRKSRRFATCIIGSLRNVTRQSHTEEAKLKNFSEGGLLLESSQEVRLRDTIEYRFEGHTLRGEVVQYSRNREKWLASIRFEQRLEAEELRRILEVQHQLSAVSY